MLDGLDDIDWAYHDGAYGPCTEAPDILRAMASPDPEVAREGRYDFASSIWHQGTVYPVTVVAVPFLIELASTPGVDMREHLLRMLGDLCDRYRANGEDQPAVQAAVAVHSGPLMPLLADPDPRIRACAAYAVANCGPHTLDALRERWTAETEPDVRAVLLPGLALRDPDGSAGLLRSAARSEPFAVRAAAALATIRAGLSLAPEVLGPVAEAFSQPENWNNPWRRHDGVLGEIFAAVDGDTATTLAGGVATAGASGARVRIAAASGSRFGRSRSAPVQLLPMLRQLLADADPLVRNAAVDATVLAGEAAATVATELAAIALSGAVAADPDRGGADTALGVLVRLDDPGHRAALLATWESGRDPWALALLDAYPISFDPAVLAAVRHRLAVLGESGPIRPDDADPSSYFAAPTPENVACALVGLLGAWGPAAASAVAEITAALPLAEGVVPGALADIGPAALPTVPLLERRAEAGDVRSGHAILRLTGDAGPLVAAASIRLARQHRYDAWELRLVADAGPAAAPLLPVLQPWLTGTTKPVPDHRYDQVAAARLAWRATGDLGLVLPTLRAVLGAGAAPAGAAASCVAEIDAGAELAPELWKLLRRGERLGRVGAARALWRSGAAVEDLAGPLLTVVADPVTDGGAVELLAEMGATGAVPRLTDLAERDERVITAGFRDPVWSDDRLRHRLRAAVSALS
ncbi:hypothetical protein I0C86_24115 [Plantactinospora sp. S1510]|uniref:PBS lyase n=1 Tax=Plantactinospora alkalitolerans TaxID=2789879 RepID=A0ABS0H0N9_9ACTN|nr:hypothetical protein [Plantactinospora alkalitolerans]MBF9132028.1 hypothetical protein [Plantactinospora alkalitolerans]